MSDAEFQRRYDPQGYFQERLLSVLERIAARLEQLDALPAIPPEQFREPPAPRSAGRGPVAL